MSIRPSIAGMLLPCAFFIAAVPGTGLAQTVVTVQISGDLTGTGTLTYQYPFDAVPVAFDLDGTGWLTDDDTHTWNGSVWDANGELTGFSVDLVDDANGPTFVDVHVQTNGTWTGGTLGGTYTLATTPEAYTDSGCAASSDAEAFATIDALRAAAEAIAIDGDDADWAGLPTFDDPPDDGPGGADKEIVAAAIAPMTDRVKLFARTAGAPSQTPGAFAVKLDLVGSPARDLLVVLVPPSGPHTVIPYDALSQPQPPEPVGIGAELLVAFGPDFVEVEIPYSALVPYLPELAPSAAPQRAWARGGIDALAGPTYDLGPSVGSYLLRPTPFALDTVSYAIAPVPLHAPVAGQWVVVQGAYGAVSHAGGFAYDLSRVDGSFLLSHPPQSASLGDYLAFGQPLLAPAAGTVTQAVGTHPDVTPGSFDAGAPANVVAIDIGGGLEASLLHAQQSSLLVNESDAVGAGGPVGAVGNSGYTFFPHVHLEVNDLGDFLGASIHGVELVDVVVSLNPGPADPWARQCPAWDVREGYLVSNFDTDGDGLCDGAAAITGVCTAGEDVNANGVVDPGETDPAAADTDGDGFDDGAERAAGTNPTNPLEFPGSGPVVPGLGGLGVGLLVGLIAGCGTVRARRSDVGRATRG